MRFDLENDIRYLEKEIEKETEENYNNRMTLIKEKEFDDLANKRY